eukprot:5836867-Prymnesium_polylepis.1
MPPMPECVASAAADTTGSHARWWLRQFQMEERGCADALETSNARSITAVQSSAGGQRWSPLAFPRPSVASRSGSRCQSTCCVAP